MLWDLPVKTLYKSWVLLILLYALYKKPDSPLPQCCHRSWLFHRLQDFSRGWSLSGDDVRISNPLGNCSLASDWLSFPLSPVVGKSSQSRLLQETVRGLCPLGANITVTGVEERGAQRGSTPSSTPCNTHPWQRAGEETQQLQEELRWRKEGQKWWGHRGTSRVDVERGLSWGQGAELLAGYGMGSGGAQSPYRINMEVLTTLSHKRTGGTGESKRPTQKTTGESFLKKSHDCWSNCMRFRVWHDLWIFGDGQYCNLALGFVIYTTVKWYQINSDYFLYLFCITLHMCKWLYL